MAPKAACRNAPAANAFEGRRRVRRLSRARRRSARTDSARTLSTSPTATTSTSSADSDGVGRGSVEIGRRRQSLGSTEQQLMMQSRRNGDAQQSPSSSPSSSSSSASDGEDATHPSRASTGEVVIGSHRLVTESASSRPTTAEIDPSTLSRSVLKVVAIAMWK